MAGVHGLDHEDEDILVSTVKFKEAFEMVEDGRIESGIPIIAIQWLYIHRDKLRKQWSD